MPEEQQNSSWSEYRKLILRQLEDLHEIDLTHSGELEKLKHSIYEIKSELRVIKFKIAVWTAFAASIITLTLKYIFGLITGV